MNRLSREKSAYLRHAARQQIHWYPWSEEAFEQARQDDKPVFLSTGAVWCHWCHVMAKESFDDPEIAQILNENFISIKLDRDERPDIDRRYQRAVAAMGSGGGWPLSVFLTPDKKAFFGGTYFPPDDSHGRAGFRKVLTAVADFYRTKRSEVHEYTERLRTFLEPKPLQPEEISPSAIGQAERAILDEFDPVNGGFGSSPKFPMPGAMEFMISRYYFTGEERTGNLITKSLESMARGGYHDQICGGFHRYSTDKEWIIPHFEKMADDNAWLLRNYTDAYALTGNGYFREVAVGIISFLRTVLSDPAGGFYASQDADVTPDDEGGYFTWTDKELKGCLDAREYEIMSRYLFHERGSMHHDPSKKVLFPAMTLEAVAQMMGTNSSAAGEFITQAKMKMLTERNKREAPFVDTAIYTSLNGMLAASCLKAFRVFGDPFLESFSLKTLARIREMHFINSELFHADGVRALLDDYIYLCEAYIAAYEATADTAHLGMAETLMEQCIRKLWDTDEGGFFDTERAVIGLRLKGIEDIPHPSPNATAITLLLKLYHLTDKRFYFEHAEQALRVFGPPARDMGIHAGSYYAALDAYLNLLRLGVYAKPGSDLSRKALSTFSPYTTIAYHDDRGYVLPCTKTECLEPLQTADDLVRFLRQRRQRP